jgi:hypothetical protein
VHDDAFTTDQTPSRAAVPPRGAWVAGGVLAGVLLFHVAALRSAEFAPDDVALGRNTVAFTSHDGARQAGGPFHDLPALLEGARAARGEGRPLVLWLGASQLYAINHPQAGDRTAVAFAQAAAAARGERTAFVQCASPNVNAHELLCMYLAFRQAGLVPERLVLAFTYDDLKEPDLRQAALEALQPLDAETLRLGGAAAARIEELRARLRDGAVAEAAAAPVQRSATAGTPQERLEDALVEWLAAHWSAWALRGPLAAAAETWWKMPVTTLAFRVFDRPQTAVPEDRAAPNREALLALLDLAAADGVRVLAYKAPHNPGVRPFFHPRAAYDREHAWLAAECAARGAQWLDLELLVPAGLWGETNNFAPDVFHFRVEGHRLLGEAVAAALAEGDG